MVPNERHDDGSQRAERTSVTARRSWLVLVRVASASSVAVAFACSSSPSAPPSSDAATPLDAGEGGTEPRVVIAGLGQDRLDPGWRWLREAPGSWRFAGGTLSLRVLPGNLWCGANDVQNVLVHPLPPPSEGDLEIFATLESAPSQLYEQVNLAYYYDDDHMVKIARELVNGSMCVVMGREAGGCETVARPPVAGSSYRVRLVVRGPVVQGAYRRDGEQEWTTLGETTLAAPPGGVPHVSIHAYNGVATEERWATVREVRVVEVGR